MKSDQMMLYQNKYSRIETRLLQHLCWLAIGVTSLCYCARISFGADFPWENSYLVCTSPTESHFTQDQRLLRQVSLDLLGHIPHEAEEADFERLGGISDALLDTFMSDRPDFKETMVAYHSGLIFPNDLPAYISHHRKLSPISWKQKDTKKNLIYDYSGKNTVFYIKNDALSHRARANQACLPGIKENHQSQFGYFRGWVLNEAPSWPLWKKLHIYYGNDWVVEDTREQVEGCPEKGCKIEGWVFVNPYWKPKVAGFVKPMPRYQAEVTADNDDDARNDSTDIETYTYQDQDYLTSAQYKALNDNPNLIKVCATDAYMCGPRLENCIQEAEFTTTYRTMKHEPLELMYWTLQEQQRLKTEEGANFLGYFEFLVTKYTMLNGLVNRFYRRFGKRIKGQNLQFGEDENGTAPSWARNPVTNANWPVSKPDWSPVKRTNIHSGILTTAFFMKRFTTNRSRVNHFRTIFMCNPFSSTSSESASDPGSTCVDEGDNLMKRCICRDCHETIEPEAAYWGRWRTGGQWGYMDAEGFPEQGHLFNHISGKAEQCSATCADKEAAIAAGNRQFCEWDCAPYYATSYEFPIESAKVGTDYYQNNLGKRRASLWLSAKQRQVGELGVAAYVRQPSVIKAMAKCTTRRMAEHLLGRPLSSGEEGIKRDDVANSGWLEEKTAAFIASEYNFKEMIKSIILDPLYQQNR